MTENNTPKTWQEIIAEIAPAYEYQGITFYFFMDVAEALEAAGALIDEDGRGYVSTYTPYNEAQVMAAADELDAVIFGYSREYPGYRPLDSEGIALALRNARRAVIWEDLS